MGPEELASYGIWIGSSCCCLLIFIAIAGAAYYFLVHKKKAETPNQRLRLKPRQKDAQSESPQAAENTPLHLDKTYDMDTLDEPVPAQLDSKSSPPTPEPAAAEEPPVLELPEEPLNEEPASESPLNLEKSNDATDIAEPVQAERSSPEAKTDFDHPPLPEVPDFDFASAPTIMPFDEDEPSAESDPAVGEDDATVLMQRRASKPKGDST